MGSNYSVCVFDKKYREPGNDFAGGVRVIADGFSTFQEAFMSWRAEVVSGQHACTPFIRDAEGTTIYNGLNTIDAKEVELDYAEACAQLARG